MLREQGSGINSDGVGAMSADSIHGMKNAKAAMKRATATPLIPCRGHESRSWIIQKEILKMSHGVSYIYTTKL